MLTTASAALLTIDVRPPDFLAALLFVPPEVELLLLDEPLDGDFALLLDAVVVAIKYFLPN